MATLFEKIAAKKAAEALAAKEMAPITPQQEEERNADIEEGLVSPKKEELTPVASVPEGKPLSFAEKMALKKLEAQKTSTSSETTAIASTVKNTETTTTTQPLSISSEKKEVPAEVIVKIVAAVAEEEDHEAEVGAATPEDQQAYYDIKAKINMLSDMSESNLPGAMKELKAALLKNPQACYLILPQDIGQMVIALRAMKNEAVVTSEKTPKEKKAKASKALTADEIALAFDEL